MSEFPYTPLAVGWKRPPIDRDVLKRCTKRSDFKGLTRCLGVIAVLGVTGAISYYFYATGQWLWMAVALYIHGGLFAFNPQTHELAHGTVFRTKTLNRLFKRVFGIIHWNSNSALYWMSHKNHHLYTLHKQSEGEVVLPMPETTENVLHQAIRVVDITRFLSTVYDQLYSMFRPYLRNPRRTVWQRYVFSQAPKKEQRDAYWTLVSQFMFHVLFAVFAIATGHWFLIVVVSLPMFYGGSWYHTLVHDTMHVGRQSEVDDFRACCRTVKVDPFTSLMFWHMEWHTEHHAFAAIPCYNLRKFHKLTAEHWDPPQSLIEAWREMNRSSEEVLVLS